MLVNYLSQKFQKQLLSLIWMEWTQIKNGKKGAASRIFEAIQRIDDQRNSMKFFHQIY